MGCHRLLRKDRYRCCRVVSVVSDSVRPRRPQSARLRRPGDSPGKNTGVGCHFLLQYMKVKSKNEVAQSCPTLCNPMDCSLPGFSIHGIFQTRVLEWDAIASSNYQINDMNLNKLWEIVEDRGAWNAAVHGVTKCQT